MTASAESSPTPRPPQKRGTAIAITIGFATLALSLVFASCLKLETRTRSIAALEPAPEFELPDHRGQLHSLASLLADGPAIVVFYRGYW
jgi:hypothetical protein